MPHRLPYLQSLTNDALAWMVVFCASLGGSIPSTSEWKHAIGPYGGYFISLVMLGIFLNRDRAATKTRREDQLKAEIKQASTEAATERRHQEMVIMQEKSFATVIELTAESIKARGLTCQTMQGVDHTLQDFKESNERASKAIVDAMKGRPCHAMELSQMFPNFPKPETKTE
jgi:hypothetical protein